MSKSSVGTRRAVRARSNAKINLFLRVRGLRTDGYHEVETVLQSVGLADELLFETTGTGRIEIDMTSAAGQSNVLPQLEHNLIYRVAERLTGAPDLTSGLRVSVTKRVPIGAGLGGGSGNAGAAIVALNELWSLGLDRVALLEVASDIGSDVPYCLSGGTTLATGRGDELNRLPPASEMWFVLGLSHEPLLTADVYAAFDNLRPSKEVSSAPLTFALGADDVAETADLLHNDLEAAAFLLRPGLEDRKQSLLDAGALGAALSGSGPSLFALASDRGHAEEIATRVGGAFDRVEVVATKPECVERVD